MAVTVEEVEGVVNSSNREARGARGRAEADGVESSRQLRGRRKLRVRRGMSSRGERQSGASETPVVNLVSSGDEGCGDDTGPGYGDGGASTASQQVLPNTPRVVRRTARVGGNQADLTPNFRSAAAMAGWDDEALLMAAIARGGTPDVVPSRAPCSNSCEGCPQCRERKRGTRTPGQATPLSAARRHRRVRRVNEEPLVPIPMAVFIDEGDKRGEPAREAEGSHQQPSEGEGDKDTKPCASTTSLKATAEGNTAKNDSLQLDKLREELTCVVCLDICFEPSTTSCGHSFCRGCLQSVYIKCGMRCPKCRQELRTTRTTSKNDCPINTVLWNTIQLLFPQETASRLKDQKSNKEKDSQTLMDSARTVEAESQLRLGLVRRRITRPVPWRELGPSRPTETQLRGPNVISSVASESLRWRGSGNQASFRRASEVLESSTSNYPNGFLRLRGRRPTSTSSWRNPETLRQEEEDAALAARLQESFISEAGL